MIKAIVIGAVVLAAVSTLLMIGIVLADVNDERDGKDEDDRNRK